MYNSKSAAAEGAVTPEQRKRTTMKIRELLARPDMQDADDRGIWERFLERAEHEQLVRTARFLN